MRLVCEHAAQTYPPLDPPGAATLIADDPKFGEFAKGLPYGRSELDAPAEIVQAVIDSMQAVLFGGVSPTDAAATAAAQMQAYIDSR